MLKLILLFSLITLLKFGTCDNSEAFKEKYLYAVKDTKEQIRALQHNYELGYYNAGIERIARIRKQYWQLWLRLQHVGEISSYSFLKRRLSNIGTMSLECSNWLEFENAQVQLNNLPKKPVLCQYNRPNNPQFCNMAYNPVVRDKPAKTDNLDELKHYWLEFRNKVGPIGKKAVQDYISQYIVSAKYFYPNDPKNHITGHYYHYYNDLQFGNKLEEIILQLMPLYKEFHAFIRNALLVYGKDVLDKGDSIPQHLFEHFLTKVWTEDHSLRIYMPYPNVPFPVVANNYQVNSIYDLSRTLFKKFIKEDRLKSKFVPLNASLDDPFCKNEIYDMSLQKAYVEVRHCPSVNFRTFLQTYGESFLTPYTIELDKNEWRMFDDHACPGFPLALAKMYSLHASSPSFIKSAKYLDDWEFEDEPRKINRLFLMGLQTLFKLFSAFVHEKLFVSMLTTNSESFNCEYWNLMEKYMGVRPPQNRNNSDFDVPIEFYEGMNPRRPFTANIISEVMGHQLYKGMCQRMNAPLGDCNVESNEQPISDMTWMKRIYGIDCLDYLSASTNEQQLNADGILELFKPIHDWLKETNKRKGSRIGFHPVEESCS